MVWMKVPYTNFHNLNQDWIIRRMMEFEEYMQNIVQISVIKYADPIQWRITGQYEQSTVVIDAETGIAYISVQPVPAGVAITNTNYWTPVFDMSQILSGIEADLQDETDARTAADQTLQDNIDAETTAREDADTALQSAIDTNADNIADEVTARENAVNALQEQIDQGLATGIEHARVKSHFRYYVDIVYGNDDADGLTQETAFKTIDRFLQETNKYNEIRGFLVSSGVYDVTYGDILQCSLHITALVPGCTLRFNTPATEPAAIYLSHWNLEGYDINNPLTIDVKDTAGDQQRIYFDNCLITLNKVNLACEMWTYGGQAIIQRCRLWRIRLQDTVFGISDGTTITNTDPNITPFSFINCRGRMIGTYTADELTSAGSMSYINATSSIIAIASVIMPAISNQYANIFAMTNGCTVFITNARLTTIRSRVAGADSIDNTCQIITDQGTQAVGSVRYYNSALQYWNGTAWTAVPTE